MRRSPSYILFLFLFFSYSVRTEELVEKNKISLSAAGWAGFMLFLLDTGINYDHVLSPKWALSAAAKYEQAAFMHGYYQGGTAELGTKFMFWSHGERAFSKGFLVGLSTGIGMGVTVNNSEPLSDKQKQKRFWMPFALAAQYMYTWNNDLFFTAGLRWQFFQAVFSKGFVPPPWPRLELSLGYAF